MMHLDVPHDVVPSVDVSREKLCRMGWSVRCAGYSEARGFVFVVNGSRGGRRLQTTGSTAALAWHRATEQAEAVDLYDNPSRGES